MPQELLYVLVVLSASLLSLFLGIYSLIKLKEAPGALYFSVAAFLCAIFTFSYAFELMSVTLEQMKFWLKMEYLVLPFIPSAIFLMCADYTGQKTTRRTRCFLFGLPILTVIINHTNDFHHFYYTDVYLKVSGPFSVAVLEGGPWFYVHSVFLYGCIMASLILLLKQMRRSLFKFRMQLLLMAAGLIVPVIGSVFYLTGTSPHGIDLGPVFMSGAFIFHGLALLSLQMFNVVPIAKETIFESMKEGVIVLNLNNIVVDYNKAMQDILTGLNTFSIGKPVGGLFEESSKLKALIDRKQEKDCELIVNGNRRHFNLRFSPVLNKYEQHIGEIITFVDVTERIYMQEKLKYLASIDGLTEMYNRTFFMKKAEQIHGNLSLENGDLAIIMFDIDHFKNVNDSFGHETGDAVIKAIAARAKENVRKQDIVGRYGGEEFIICLPGASLKQAYEVADRIREKVADSFLLIGDKKINVTSSFGISSVSVKSDGQGKSLHTLVQEADQALYFAKRRGRNCVHSYRQMVLHIK